MEEKGNEAEEEMQLQQTTMPTTLPRLNEDLIYLVIEKMFFAVGREGNRRTEMDLRAPDNAYTRFMCLNRCHFNAMLAQFAKMKRIDFYADLHGEEMGVNFYRNQEDYNEENEDEGVFSGPYQVTGHLVSRLIHYGKLRPIYLKTDNFLNDKEPIKMSLEGKKPLEVFSALFLDKVIEVPDGHDLQIEKLVLDEDPEEIYRHFEAILALNSEEIVIFHYEFPLSKTTIFDCKVDDSTTTYHKTKKIRFYQRVWGYEPKKELALLAKTWTGRLIPFLAKVCPNLSLLEYKVNADFCTKASIASDFVDGLTHLVEAIQDMLISELADGSPQLSIRLKLCLRIEVGNYQSLPLNSHELFQLGTPIVQENVDTRSRYTARAIKMADKLGREHEFVFKIFEDSWLTESDDSDDWARR